MSRKLGALLHYATPKSARDHLGRLQYLTPPPRGRRTAICWDVPAGPDAPGLHLNSHQYGVSANAISEARVEWRRRRARSAGDNNHNNNAATGADDGAKLSTTALRVPAGPTRSGRLVHVVDRRDHKPPEALNEAEAAEAVRVKPNRTDYFMIGHGNRKVRRKNRQRNRGRDETLRVFVEQTSAS